MPSQTEGTKRGLFLSDLHLMSQRSIGEEHWLRLTPTLQEVDLVVFGGDIFDLRWSRYPHLEDTIIAARQWIENAIQSHPHMRWVYLLGNHDSHPQFQQMLGSVADTFPNFDWHQHLYRIGCHLFLHGDLLDAGGGKDEMETYRKRFHEEHSKGTFPNLFYRVLVQTRVHRKVPQWRHRTVPTCRRLLTAFREWEIDREEIRSVYFGHTHVPILRAEVDGIQFFNPGSGIRYLAFHPILFPFHGEDENGAKG